MGKFEIATVAVIAGFAAIAFGMRTNGGSAPSAAAAGIHNLDPNTYQSRILNSSGLAVVEFYADW